jgi:hypothetical protein
MKATIGPGPRFQSIIFEPSVNHEQTNKQFSSTSLSLSLKKRQKLMQAFFPLPKQKLRKPVLYKNMTTSSKRRIRSCSPISFLKCCMPYKIRFMHASTSRQA